MKMKVTLISLAALLCLVSMADVKLKTLNLNFIAPKVSDINSVPPTEEGLIVFDTSDEKFKGRRTDGSFATFGIPAGTVLPFAGSSTPAGYLLCNGQTVSRTTYAELYAVVGNSYGSGNGTTTFHVPDLRGKFVRGVDNSSGEDGDASSRTACNTGGATGDNVGSCQSDQFRAHSHSSPTPATSPDTGAPAGGRPVVGLYTTNSNQFTTQSSGGTDTRPKNVALNYIIKI